MEQEQEQERPSRSRQRWRHLWVAVPLALALVLVGAALRTAVGPPPGRWPTWVTTGLPASHVEPFISDSGRWATLRDGVEESYVLDVRNGDVAGRFESEDPVLVTDEGVTVVVGYEYVIAYSATGRERWRTPLPQGLGGPGTDLVARSDDMLVLRGSCSTGPTTRLVGVDVATGRITWRKSFRDDCAVQVTGTSPEPAFLAQVGDGPVVVYDTRGRELMRLPARADTTSILLSERSLLRQSGKRVTKVDYRSGREAWASTVCRSESTRTMRALGDTDAYVEVECRDGSRQMVDTGTGEVVPCRACDTEYVAVVADADRRLIGVRQSGGTLSGVDLVTGRTRWQRPAASGTGVWLEVTPDFVIVETPETLNIVDVRTGERVSRAEQGDDFDASGLGEAGVLVTNGVSCLGIGICPEGVSYLIS